ncbi:glycosyltransferase family 4 protein [Opitutus sp. GAS368]|uniref:glycosyltransferase family 4 protein n=1 Tax=Opitutus sp. GAS368 TaxID=1882749 RepID=UPI00087B4997|nr:glycosyltransferase family 4 protein [Opitutus sp. GAS368]SDS41362.1 Glycosyltransferase involved in cell wall bisynthesis [Opitutus sp. GAS368]
MKLLFVHDRLGAQAGAESNLRHTAAELQRRGHMVALAHGPGTGQGEADWRLLFAERYDLSAGDPVGTIGTALEMFRPDLVYLHNPPGLAVVEALAEVALPVVRMVHDHQLFCLRGCKYPAWSRRPCARALSPFCVFPCGGFVRRAASGDRSLEWASYAAKKRELELHREFYRLVVASEYMRAELRRNGFAPEQIEIHAPVPPPAVAAAPLPVFGPRNLIVYAGQIARGKGVDVLLESLAMVRWPFECVILGDGHHRAHCEELSRRLGLADRVRFLGYVPQAELAHYYREATLALVSSVWPEPFGAAGLEAMRCGLPVVAFDVGGISEWLLDGVNGLLVPWMNRTGFALGVEMLLADKALARRLGARGRVLAGERFDFDRYVSGLEALFARATAPDSEVLA